MEIGNLAIKPAKENWMAPGKIKIFLYLVNTTSTLLVEWFKTK
jgi:hypothetical protein